MADALVQCFDKMGLRSQQKAYWRRYLAPKITETQNLGLDFTKAPESLLVYLHKEINNGEAPGIILYSYHISVRHCEHSVACEATVKCGYNKSVYHTVADGNGPINALDNAIRCALVGHCEIPDEIVSYSASMLSSSQGSRARVLVEMVHSSRYGLIKTAAVDDNILNASIKNIIEAIEYTLLAKRFNFESAMI